MKELCTVSIKPSLQPLSGETLHHKTAIAEDGAHPDIALVTVIIMCIF